MLSNFRSEVFENLVGKAYRNDMTNYHGYTKNGNMNSKLRNVRYFHVCITLKYQKLMNFKIQS